MHARMESPNISAQKFELNPSYLAQAHPNKLDTGPEHENTEPGFHLSAFHLWFVHLEARTPSPTRLFKRFGAAGTNWHLDLSLS